MRKATKLSGESRFNAEAGRRETHITRRVNFSLTFTQCVIYFSAMERTARHVVRYSNRKLYEPKERRFVTIHDLARTVASGGHVVVRSADTGENITAKILSRALASERAAIEPSTDALARILRAGSEAAETVAGVVERVGGTSMAASMRRAASPQRLAETLAPVTRRLEDARQEVERIVGSLVGRGRLTWEEGARLKDDVGTIFRESLSDVLGRVRDLLARVQPTAQPQLAQEIADVAARVDQLESLANETFPAAAVFGGPRPPAAPRSGAGAVFGGPRPPVARDPKPAPEGAPKAAKAAVKGRKKP
jgi:ABC-type transporter Mla subunit MlaD